MSDAPKPPSPLSPAPPKPEKPPTSILLVSYPKIVFLYPVLVASIVAAIVMSLLEQPFDVDSPSHRMAAFVSATFLCILALNLVVLAFDFPRTTSLTLFFFLAAVVMGMILLFVYHPDYLPFLKSFLAGFHPVANTTFFCGFAGILGLIFLAVMVAVRFDYWEVRPNELLHHHGVLANLERLSAPNLRLDKEINDIFEYFLLRSGRLILQPSNERKAIVLDNIPFIKKKEAAITRMLGALQVQVREDEATE